MEKFYPLLERILGGLVRVALGPVIMWLIAKGVITESQTAEVITMVVTFALMGAWVVWNKVKELRVLNTAAAIGKPATIEEIKALIASGISAPAATPTNERPVLTGTGDGSVK